MAGHKGYGLAVLVEILTAVLTGSAMMGEVHSWVADDPEPPNQGHAFLVLDVGAMMPREQFFARMATLSAAIKGADPAAGGAIYLPGEMEWQRREQALAEGIALPEDVLISLRGLAADSGIDPPGSRRPRRLTAETAAEPLRVRIRLFTAAQGPPVAAARQNGRLVPSARRGTGRRLAASSHGKREASFSSISMPSRGAR